MRNPTRRPISVLSLLAGAAALSAAFPAGATGPLRPVALTGTSGPFGPGLGPDVTFSDMVLVKTVHLELGDFVPSAPSISASGAVAFGAHLAGPSITMANGEGIFAARGGAGLAVVARRGDQIPHMAAGYTFGEFNTAPQVSGTNTVVFQSMIEGSGISFTTDDAMFTERSASGWVFPLVLENTTPVPERQTPAGVFGQGQLPQNDPWGNNQWVMTRAGDVAFRCFVNDPPVNFNNFAGIYTDFGGTLAKHSRPGDTFSILGGTLTFYGQSNPRINDSGAIMTTRLSDGFQSLTPWSNRARDANGFGIPGVGPLHPLFIQGDIAPGTNMPFLSCWSLRDFSLNAAGRVGFAADLGADSIGAQGGYWSDGRFGALQLIALSGGIAPGTGGHTFNTNSGFVLGSALSDNNCVVLNCLLFQDTGIGGGNDTGLWTTRSATTGQPGNLRLLVREGDPCPASAGPDFDGLTFGEITSFWVNASGRAAFVTLHNDFTRAIWIEQADGSLVPIVKEFTFLDVSGNGSDQRLISQIDVIETIAPTGDGRRVPFNDSNDIAVRILFADGSQGIFTTAPAVACSAPTTTAPQSLNVVPGVPVTFSVTTTGSGPLHRQWRRNGVPIPNEFGASFTIAQATLDWLGTYDCVVSNACGTVTSAGATLNIHPRCAADFNGVGGITVQDIFDFLSAWFAGNPAADFNGNNGINVQDIFDFLSAWFQGC